MTDAALLAHIGRLPHARANFKQLVRELGAKGATRDGLEAALDRLEGRGDLVGLRSGHYAVTARSREYAAGRLNMHRDGYGFLIADRLIEGIKGDIYIPANSARKAMHGDRILVKIQRVEADGRADGEIVKVLDAAIPPLSANFTFAAKVTLSRRTMTASANGSKFPKAWRFRRRTSRWTAWESRRLPFPMRPSSTA